MKKTAISLIFLCMIAYLSGCLLDESMETAESPDITPAPTATEQTPEPTPTPTATPEPTPEPTPTPVPTSTPEPGLVQSNKPFCEDDIIGLFGETISVKQMNSWFGKPISAFAPSNQFDSLHIHYDNAYVELWDFPRDINDGYDLLTLEDMNEEDMQEQLRIALIWIRRDPKDLFKIRGVGIGSSKDEVIAAFPNYSDKYGNNTLYTVIDMYDRWDYDWSNGAIGGKIISNQNAKVEVARVIDGEIEYTYETISSEVIKYSFVYEDEYWPITPEDWTFNLEGRIEFFIENDLVVGIVIQNFTSAS